MKKFILISVKLNDLVFENNDPTLTPLDQLFETAREDGTTLNWVHYSEALFPSTRNEFSSGSRERLGYDNKYWRDAQEERIILGSNETTITVAGVDFLVGFNSFGIPVSQSSWILDAPRNFLTRTEIISGTTDLSVSPVINTQVRLTSSAGELQNEYIMCPISASDTSGLLSTVNLVNRWPSGLLSRKHNLTSPNSVVFSYWICKNCKSR